MYTCGRHSPLPQAFTSESGSRAVIVLVLGRRFRDLRRPLGTRERVPDRADQAPRCLVRRAIPGPDANRAYLKDGGRERRWRIGGQLSPREIQTYVALSRFVISKTPRRRMPPHLFSPPPPTRVHAWTYLHSVVAGCGTLLPCFIGMSDRRDAGSTWPHRQGCRGRCGISVDIGGGLTYVRANLVRRLTPPTRLEYRAALVPV